MQLIIPSFILHNFLLPSTLTLPWNYIAARPLHSGSFHEQLKEIPLISTARSGKTLVQPHFSRTTFPRYNAVQKEIEGKREANCFVARGCNTVGLQRQRCQTAHSERKISKANALFSIIATCAAVLPLSPHFLLFSRLLQP